MITSKSAQKRFAWDSVSMVKNSQWKNNKTIRKKEKKNTWVRVNRNDKQWIKPQTQKSSDIEILGYIILKIIRHIKINQQYVSEARVKENDNLKKNQIKKVREIKYSVEIFNSRLNDGSANIFYKGPKFSCLFDSYSLCCYCPLAHNFLLFLIIFQKCETFLISQAIQI